jgi:exonuclease III
LFCWNANGLAQDRIEQPEVVGDIPAELRKHDVICILETLNNSDITEYMPDYVFDKYPGDKHTKGHGMLVGIRKSLSDTCFFQQPNTNIPLMWVKLPQYYIGFVYMPYSLTKPGADADLQTQALAALQADIMSKQTELPVIIMGDFNAHIGSLMMHRLMYPG